MATLRVKHIKSLLKEEDELIMDLQHRFSDQETIVRTIDRKASRLEKKGAEAMMKACKMAFAASFKKCKSMVQAHFPIISIMFLHANLLDGSFSTVVNEGIESTIKISKRFTYKTNANVAYQIKEDIGFFECHWRLLRS